MRRQHSFVPALVAAALGVAALMALPTGPAGASDPVPGPTSGEGDEAAAPEVDPALSDIVGDERVLVILSAPPIAEGGTQSAVGRQQADFVSSVGDSLDGQLPVLASVDTVLNGVFVLAGADAIPAIAADPRVTDVVLVRDSELMLSETVPYIGATAVRATGVDGAGVTVAVLDSGIDYTHAALGGPGTLAAYQAAAGANASSPLAATTDGLFPTSKVVGGADFVGESWPNTTPEAQDPDPIDRNGHGTHVADIIGGTLGVAPGVSLYAYKVCSAVASACSGMAEIQALDAAADPNNDGNTSDHVDVVNLSLGSNYGQPYDGATTQAVDNLTAVGTVAIISAGNGSDVPFIVGTPSAARTALSVAETSVPSGTLNLLRVTAPAAIAGPYSAVHQMFSPSLTTTISGPIQYGNGAGGNLDGCAAFTPGSLTGKIVLVDRGTCSFQKKVVTISQGGGSAAVIGLIASGMPFSGSPDPSAGTPTVPGFMISQADANRIKQNLPVTATLSPADEVSTKGQMVGSSSRGPSNQTFLIKPEIGAPGASVSALVGTGTGTGTFGGTSGAAPMVAGAAALIRDKHPTWTPLQVKYALMNTAERNILDKPTQVGGVLAPITRIGNGEVRVDRAAQASAIAYVKASASASLSFGFVDVPATTTLTRAVTVHNFATMPVTFIPSVTFRDPADKALGAVTLRVPPSVTAPAGGDATFTVTMTISPTKLRPWTADAGAQGTDPAWLTLLEFDGDIVLTSTSAPTIHLAWHVLPRRASNIVFAGTGLTNSGRSSATVDVFSLIGTSPNLPAGPQGGEAPVPDLRYAGYAVGSNAECASGRWIEFAGVTWEAPALPFPPNLLVFQLDIDRDGTMDRDVYAYPWNSESDNRLLVYAHYLDTDQTYWLGFADNDTFAATTVLGFCPEDVGIDGAELVDVHVQMKDWWFRYVQTDQMPTTTIDISGPRHVLLSAGVPVAADRSVILAAGASRAVSMATVSTSGSEDTGLLLVQRNGAKTGREALTVLVPGAPSGVTARAGDAAATVRWTAGTRGGDASIGSYRIQSSRRATASGPFGPWRTVVASTGTASTSHRVTGLVNGSFYRFRVASISVGGVSGWSAASTAVRPS